LASAENNLKLLYDKHDLPFARRLQDERFRWLREIGAVELEDVELDKTGFLFGYQQSMEALHKQVDDRPNVRDRPEEREELLLLDNVLQRFGQTGVTVPTPRTWVIQVDDSLPADIEFPLFVRTATSSWKRGGHQGKARNPKELEDEIGLLRRMFGWNATILARKWLDLAVAGKWMYGNAPQEVRIWIVDKVPVAWSFHYIHVVKNPKGFPPSRNDLALLRQLGEKVATPFGSRLIAADFVRDRKGQWQFVEAGPGACSGTGHEAVFKFVARKLIGETGELTGDEVGGVLDEPDD
jgi:hypothetical protein